VRNRAAKRRVERAPRRAGRIAVALLYSSAEFNLRATREDSGSSFGATLETVSRTLSRLQKRGLIDAQGTLSRIPDLKYRRRV
jgi:CRP-like cAMP-binding protein